MDDRTEKDRAEAAAPSRRRAALFVALLSLYYGIYSVVFADRVSQYLQDVLRHFAFVRRLF